MLRKLGFGKKSILDDPPLYKDKSIYELPYQPGKPPRRRVWSRVWSLLRTATLALLIAFAIYTFQLRKEPEPEEVIEPPQFDEVQTSLNEDTVLGNCLSLDVSSGSTGNSNAQAIRHSDDCYEAFEFSKGAAEKLTPKRKKKPFTQHIEHEREIPWVSSYGIVLDFDAAYDRISNSNMDERYTTKRTLKCLVGSHISVVWDIHYSTSLIHAYQKGTFGMTEDTTSFSCPLIESESAASMSIKINCGFDIERDAWDNPARESDHDAIEHCLRTSYDWVNKHIGKERLQVAPWANLCQSGDSGEYCDHLRFNLEEVGSR